MAGHMHLRPRRRTAQKDNQRNHTHVTILACVQQFVATWAFSLIVWKTRRIEQRWGGMVES